MFEFSKFQKAGSDSRLFGVYRDTASKVPQKARKNRGLIKISKRE
jgi:hypothetical protein